jgi:hypothetical protein
MPGQRPETVDELRLRAICHIGDGQPHGTGHRLEIDSAVRIPFGFQFRPEFVASFEYEALGRVDLDNLASVGEPPVGKDHLP